MCEEDCILSEWAEWGPCSESCGSDGQQVSFLFVYYLVYLPIYSQVVLFLFLISCHILGTLFLQNEFPDIENIHQGIH